MDEDLSAQAWWVYWCFPDEISTGRWKLSVERWFGVEGRRDVILSPVIRGKTSVSVSSGGFSKRR
ncbi:hypothetical protein F2Q70_00027836 [Brassica cretica]|uniref:Uncharacterized protein n=1 Tax=Brassica cretica TaxID=69181 RepID=A0A8S9LC52_BRACR|nr:hypothetical protein F2Q68_00027419 [Brassica cretica]KAF2603812.1 hypothetical protein F2Q70_00027836 [Brassica cretica]